MDLSSPIKDFGLTYRINSKKLEKLGIKTIEDLLSHIPARYEDYRNISKISPLQEGEEVTLQGKVIKKANIKTKGWKSIQVIRVKDESGEIDCTWFNQKFILSNLKVGNSISLSGIIKSFNNKKSLMVKDYEILTNFKDTIHTGRLVPIYPETKGLSSKWIRNRINEIIKKYKNEIKEHLPYSITNNYGLTGFVESLEQVHFPKNLNNIDKAKYRLSFDELFLTQLAANYKKKEWKNERKASPFKIKDFEEKINFLIKSLPFELTGAQNKAIKEIFSDLSQSKSMNRLLEGEVGSGKTIVAAVSIYLAYLNNFKSLLMAPTEILAKQHFKVLDNLLSPLNIKVSLVIGGNSSKNKKEPADVAVGTHALLNKNFSDKNLGLVIIDEQQRFGVEQRTLLRKKGKNPHFLTMTATPIPRTILLTLYGNLDLSRLDEMPKERKKVKTWLVPEEKRKSAYEWIKKQIENGGKVFIVCPFIEPSETINTVKAAKDEYEKLKSLVFPEFNLSLLHGKLKSSEKNKVMEEFKNGQSKILVATPVVEVGIDVKDATIIIIEDAERFGLAQLHQLRGRVGRGNKESYCLLFTSSKNSKTLERLKIMEKENIGAKLAEYDLKLRGPGELYGTMQHGKSYLKIASFSDFALIEKTKKAAIEILPQLTFYPDLYNRMKSKSLDNVSPD